MAGNPVPDEYYERYRQLSHDDLHRQLVAGSPKQIAKVAHAWQVAQDAVESIAATLRADLARLTPQWQSTGGREFQYRIDVVRAYAQRLSEEAVGVRNGLTVMGAALGEAQRKAESTQTALPVDGSAGVLNASFGHTMIAEEQAKAAERMVTLVAGLAAEYGLTDHGSWPVTMPEPPPDLPGLDSSVTGSVLTAVGTVDQLPESPDPGAGLTAQQPIAAQLTGTQQTGTQLAGVGSLGAGSVGLVGLSPVQLPSAEPAPAAVLSGVAPGLSGALGYRRTAEPHPVTAAATGGTAMPPMTGVGPGAAGDPARQYAITDPRLATDPGAGWTGERTGWQDDDDAPPAVLGGSD